jgi:antitoxin component YwqK of YwqJK toxin-antitoxin module
MNSNDPTTVKSSKPPTIKPLRHYVEYYFNSNAKYREYNLNESDQWHGLYEAWNPNGQLLIRCNIQNGIRHGLYEQWYPNGSLRSRLFYNNDKIE